MKTDIDLEQFPKEILTDHKIFHFEPQKFRDWIEKGQNEYLVVSLGIYYVFRAWLNMVGMAKGQKSTEK